MNIAYFGSPEISASLLKELLTYKDISISLVVTQPDKPAGKRLEMQSTAVKLLAKQQNLDLFDNKSLHSLENILMRKHIDLCIVFAYGRLIPSSLLTIPTYGFWNIHPSLLPLFRGPAPIVYPLILGSNKTGTTLMQMDKGLDTGDIILQKQINISQSDTKVSVEKKLISLSAKLISQSITALCSTKTLQYKPQNHSKATYTRLLKKNDGYIAPQLITHALQGNKAPLKFIPDILHEYFNLYATELLHTKLFAAHLIFQLYNGLHPWPGLWTKIDYKHTALRLKILDLYIKNNTLVIKRVQLEGKKPVDYSTFIKAYNIKL